MISRHSTIARGTLVAFQSNAKGGVDRVLVPVETALPPVVFVREP